MSAKDEDAEILLQVVRGTLPPSALEMVEIIIRISETAEGARVIQVDNPRSIEVCPEARDFAHGLLSYADDRSALSVWASAVYVAGDDFIDWHRVEQHPAGPILLDALWDASFGVSVREEAFAVARQLIGEASSPESTR